MNKDARDVFAAIAMDPAGVHTLATVVTIAGSSYRRPGARLLVHAAGFTAGSVSGGCLERAIVHRGRWWAEGGPVVRRFSGDDSGCGGTVDVLIENVTSESAAIAALRWVAARREPACIATVIDGGAIGERSAFTAGEAWPGASSAWRDDASHVIAGAAPAWRREVFLEYVPPPRELLVAGRHHDVAPVVRLARMLGWDVAVAAAGVPVRQLGDPDRLVVPEPEAVAAWLAARPASAVLLMTHDLELDRRLLAAVLAIARPPYLGVLGPRHRTVEVVRDVPPHALDAVRSPVGLDLGGDGPEAIALSIVADLQATWHARSGARLGTSFARPQLASAS